tara:strand:+ start:1119 stop:1358 length:240 start_codon:yes stop_codon:yes gene_type:complete
MKELKFFTTQGCHLCEQAEEILVTLQKEYIFELEVIDIAADKELVERYGLSIPVLLNAATGEELYWPFNADKIASLLDV